MGTAAEQGELWGAQAKDWAELQEGFLVPCYEAVFERAGLRTGASLLDVGCGSGRAMALGAKRGAAVSGLDASAALVELARARNPKADVRVGEMEELPFPAATFDLVTGFNSFQYAGDALSAIKQARKVAKPGGKVAMALWGRPADCQHAATLKAVGSCLPAPPAGAAGPFALSEPGLIEDMMARAGLQPLTSSEVDCPFSYSNLEAAWRALASSGPVVRAVRHAGEEKVKAAVLESLAPFRNAQGAVRQANKFRYVIASV